MTGARMFGLLLLAVSALALSALFAARLPDELSDAPAPGPAARHAPVTVPEMPRVLGVSLPVLIAAEAAVGTIGLTGLAATLTVRRVRRRTRREYALYDLHLSPHDEAKPQDLEDAIEAIANIVRAFPTDRARTGQPYLALELLHGTGASGDMEWSIGLRCEPKVAVAIDGALSAPPIPTSGSATCTAGRRKPEPARTGSPAT